MQWAFDETVVTSDGCFWSYRRSNSARRKRWEDLVRDWQVCADIGVRVVSLAGGLYQRTGNGRKYLREEALDMAYATYLSTLSAGTNGRLAFADWVTVLIEFLAFRLVKLKVTSGDAKWTVASEIGVLPWWLSLGHPGDVVVTSERSIVSWPAARDRVEALLLDRWTVERIAEFRA